MTSPHYHAFNCNEYLQSHDSVEILCIHIFVDDQEDVFLIFWYIKQYKTYKIYKKQYKT